MKVSLFNAENKKTLCNYGMGLGVAAIAAALICVLLAISPNTYGSAVWTNPFSTSLGSAMISLTASGVGVASIMHLAKRHIQRPFSSSANE